MFAKLFSKSVNKNVIAEKQKTTDLLDISLRELNILFSVCHKDYLANKISAGFASSTYIKTFGEINPKLSLHVVSDEVLINLIATFIKDREFNNKKNPAAQHYCKYLSHGVFALLSRNLKKKKFVSDCQNSLFFYGNELSHHSENFAKDIGNNMLLKAKQVEQAAAKRISLAK